MNTTETNTAESKDTGTLSRERLTAPLLSIVAILAALVAAWAWSRAGGFGTPQTTFVVDRESPFRGFAVSPERPAPPIELTAHTGEPYALSEARGGAVLLFFGFTYCPDVCPTTLASLGAALGELGDEADNVTVALVSVDPERDTPERLAEYLGGFQSLEGNVVGLTGTLEEITAISEAYGVFFEKEGADGGPPPETGYNVAHSSSIFLIDHHGALRASFSQPLPEDVAHDVRYVLGNG